MTGFVQAQRALKVTIKCEQFGTVQRGPCERHPGSSINCRCLGSITGANGKVFCCQACSFLCFICDLYHRGKKQARSAWDRGYHPCACCDWCCCLWNEQGAAAKTDTLVLTSFSKTL